VAFDWLKRQLIKEDSEATSPSPAKTDRGFFSRFRSDESDEVSAARAIRKESDALTTINRHIDDALAGGKTSNVLDLCMKADTIDRAIAAQVFRMLVDIRIQSHKLIKHTNAMRRAIINDCMDNPNIDAQTRDALLQKIHDDFAKVILSITETVNHIFQEETSLDAISLSLDQLRTEERIARTLVKNYKDVRKAMGGVKTAQKKLTKAATKRKASLDAYAKAYEENLDREMRLIDQGARNTLIVLEDVRKDAAQKRKTVAHLIEDLGLGKQPGSKVLEKLDATLQSISDRLHNEEIPAEERAMREAKEE
jgi:ferritin